MEQTTASEIYDLLILVDSTASMSNYLRSLKESLPQIISISALTGCFERIGVLAYRDYDQPPEYLLEWTGWLSSSDLGKDKTDIVGITSRLRTPGGYDWPEATKTGLARAYQLMRTDATTLILLYTDAPPHLKGDPDGAHNVEKERVALVEEQKFGQHGTLFADWAMAAQTLASSNKRAHVLSILDNCMQDKTDQWYWFLSEVTGGATIVLQDQQPRAISEVTIEALLSWMGVRKEGSESRTLPARLVRYERIDGSVNPSDDAARSKAPPTFDLLHDEAELTHRALWRKTRREAIQMSRTSLDQNLPGKKTALPNFTQTYKSSEKYRAVVKYQLREIISRDVSAMSLNPVFGSLWRVFCNDRENEYRQELLDLFGRKIEDIHSGDEKSRMKDWLAESYDYTAEVRGVISTVPASRQFPCVCLDPTLVFSKHSDMNEDEDDEDDDEDKPITSFSRDELLEIGRSCDGRILRRLGRILTRLTFIKSADDMPAHIATTSDEDVPRIPIALASEEFGRNLWRILLHIVVPGTMLSGRPGALLAALAIRLGITPLFEAAAQEMLFWRAKWNNIEVPENWNSSCLTLLLDADKAHRRRVPEAMVESSENGTGLLQDEDRAIFERLVEYKLLERNLDTTLTARVGWTPQRSSLPIGSVVTCRVCELPRSVTIMGEDNTCGLCLTPCEGVEAQQKALHTRVSRSDNAGSSAVWYECNVPTCRGQYVVYNVEELNVRPKCHFCRTEGVTADNGKKSSAPLVECVKCLSRVIWPLGYRNRDSHVGWECVACRNGTQTIIEADVTANQLRAGNGQEWLLGNTDQKLGEPFNNRSLFHVASRAMPLHDLCERLTILPGETRQNLELFIRNKLIRNTPDLMGQLHSWIYRRRTQFGTCSLCFSDKRKNDLRPACGRSGCRQLICMGCLEGWYGLNSPGRVINTAALSCPFCRRAPIAKTLANYGMGIHAVGDLREAVERRGEWIYAWCGECGYAKQYMERVCAGGAPPDLKDWMCDTCQATITGDVMKKVKPCPGCGIPTEKISGCDHITCRCGAHWCFFCGEKHDARTIYVHISKAHGGFYQGFAYDIQEDEVDEEDD